MNHWNELFHIIHDEEAKKKIWKPDRVPFTTVSQYAEMLLNQFNTASGSVIMKPTIEKFVEAWKNRDKHENSIK